MDKEKLFGTIACVLAIIEFVTLLAIGGIQYIAKDIVPDWMAFVVIGNLCLLGIIAVIAAYFSFRDL